MSHPLPAKPGSGSTSAAPTPTPSTRTSTATCRRAIETTAHTGAYTGSVGAIAYFVVAYLSGWTAGVCCCRVPCLDWGRRGDRECAKACGGVAAGAPDIATALAAIITPNAKLTLWAFALVTNEVGAPRLSALDFSDLGLTETTPPLASFELAHLHPCGHCEAAPTRASLIAPYLPTMAIRTACPRSRTPHTPTPTAYSTRFSSTLHTHPPVNGAVSGLNSDPHPRTRPYISRPPAPTPLSPSHILIHLYPHQTHLYPLPTNASIAPGTPLRLLPAFAPAYALAPYTGHTPSGPYGFAQSLGGRGVPPSASVSPCILVWLPLPATGSPAAASPSGLPTPSATTPAAATSSTGSRGMYAIWPRTLCVVDSKLPSIDVAKLPMLPPGLSTQGPGWTKPRRFGANKTRLVKPISLAPSANPGSQPSTSNTIQDGDPSLVALANTASNLIDAVVRAREKEKEKQRARMERARSGSASIPALATSAPSTPVDAIHPIHTPPPPSPPQLLAQPQPDSDPSPNPNPDSNQTQTQTPTSLANTPIQYVARQTLSAPAAHTQPPIIHASPSASDAFDLGMDLFGDAEYNAIGVDPQDPVYADAGFAFPLDGWGVADVPADSKSSDDQVQDSDFDFFGDQWTAGGASAAGAAASGAASDTPQGGQLQLITPVAQDQLMDVDLDLGIDLGLEMEVESATNDKDKDKEKEEETENENVKEKEATPVLDDDTGGAWDPLKFGEKYQNVDDKYRGTQGKFGVRGGLTVPPSRPRARTFNQGRIEEGTARESWALSFCATPTSVLAKRIELGLGLRPRSSSSLSFQQQPSPQLQLSKSQPNPYVFQARPYPQLQLHHLPQFQLKNQLPTPSPSPNAHRKLRSGYINLTNPSAKRIRTLRLAHSQPVMSTNTARPVFARDWVPIVAPQSPTATVVSSASEDSDSSADDDDDEFIPGTAPRSAAPSRGTTPPTSAHPNGLLSSPPGPALLVAMFRPNALGSGMLGDVLTWTSQDSKEKPVVPVSVPTPVSPREAAVAVGTVEAGVNVLAREAVDNWAWGADQVIQADTPTPATQPSRTNDAPRLVSLCARARARVRNNDTVQADGRAQTRPPSASDHDGSGVPGHSGQVVQVYAPALRFWEVVGLEPVGGAKDVVAYAVVEEGEEVGVVKRWMERVGQVYETRRLGKHVVGDVGGGVVSVKWESMVKTLVSFISSLPLTQSHIILYLIIPQRAFSSPALRSFIPTLESNKFISTLSEHRHRLSTHLVPASLLFDHSTTPPESRQRLVSTALSVYDRIPRTVGRRIRREIISLDIPAHTSVHVPAYTLARPLAPRFRFSMDWPDAQREVFDRHMFLHVGYSYSKSKRWLGATCIDERGEAYETKVWMCEEWSVGKVIAKVWSFAMRFAKRAAIEWRIVFCKMGEMEWDEVQAWEAHTSAKMSGDTRLGMHVSVLRFDLVTGLALSTSASPSVKAPVAPAGTPPSTVVDLTANDYLVLPGYDTEVCTIPDLDSPVSDSTPSVLPLATAHYFRLTDPPITRPMGRLTEIPSKTDDPPVGLLSSQLHLLHFNLTQNSSLWKSGGDPWRELLQSFYALTTLTQTRFPSLDPLPIHLAMLNIILGVSDNRELVPVDLTLESSS
ncbi:mediator complex subunit 13 carboxy-terminal protein [Rhizoctonia solani]|uniref:Mediator of RNA polymerase II transcription subunit 13 n=1 Tax=Rhizoctonia solani TaxID=456999 RepID=A0A8H8NM68_9AGAM|nr:mediator complex subunit 13 carboxy-terminal protein [Rhizoctonia solani]QRW15725.1 mediator complex subunit 13 carboxy-terminal protein [Rhizoctonia solani]